MADCGEAGAAAKVSAFLQRDRAHLSKRQVASVNGAERQGQQPAVEVLQAGTEYFEFKETDADWVGDFNNFRLGDATKGLGHPLEHQAELARFDASFWRGNEARMWKHDFQKETAVAGTMQADFAKFDEIFARNGKGKGILRTLCLLSCRGRRLDKGICHEGRCRPVQRHLGESGGNCAKRPAGGG